MNHQLCIDPLCNISCSTGGVHVPVSHLVTRVEATLATLRHGWRGSSLAQLCVWSSMIVRTCVI